MNQGKQRADFTAAIRIDFGLAEAYGNRSLLYAQSGNKAIALQDLQTAAKLFQQQGNQASCQETLASWGDSKARNETECRTKGIKGRKKG